MKRYLLPLALALLVSGCGGSDDEPLATLVVDGNGEIYPYFAFTTEPTRPISALVAGQQYAVYLAPYCSDELPYLSNSSFYSGLVSEARYYFDDEFIGSATSAPYTLLYTIPATAEGECVLSVALSTTATIPGELLTTEYAVTVSGAN